jgi:hypothetical protein
MLEVGTAFDEHVPEPMITGHRFIYIRQLTSASLPTA